MMLSAFNALWPLVAFYVGFRLLFWVCGIVHRYYKRTNKLRG